MLAGDDTPFGVFILLPAERPFSIQDNLIDSTEIVNWLTVFVLSSDQLYSCLQEVRSLTFCTVCSHVG
jgi:hypothetical protein